MKKHDSLSAVKEVLVLEQPVHYADKTLSVKRMKESATTISNNIVLHNLLLEDVLQEEQLEIISDAHSWNIADFIYQIVLAYENIMNEKESETIKPQTFQESTKCKPVTQIQLYMTEDKLKSQVKNLKYINKSWHVSRWNGDVNGETILIVVNHTTSKISTYKTMKEGN